MAQQLPRLADVRARPTDQVRPSGRLRTPGPGVGTTHGRSRRTDARAGASGPSASAIGWPTTWERAAQTQRQQAGPARDGSRPAHDGKPNDGGTKLRKAPLY